MRTSMWVARWVFAVLLLVSQSVRADALGDRFSMVWESLWFQGGSPTSVVRWPGEIRVHVRGMNQSFHRERIVKSLQLVAAAAGRTVVDVTDQSDAATVANLDAEIVANNALQDNFACFVRFERVTNDLIGKALLKMRDGAVYRCVLHEAMHVMGIRGHPSGNTVLSYFYQRVDAITDLDRLMLKAWYSPGMSAGMTPFAALQVLTQAVVDADAGATPDASARRARFHAETLAGMESYVRGEGEVPVILKRSGTASAEGMRFGKRVMAYYLGTAYAEGVIAVADPKRSFEWFERSALDGLVGGQIMMGRLHEKGEGGAPQNASEAFFWFSLAAAQGSTAAQAQAQRVASVLTPEERAKADARISAFK